MNSPIFPPMKVGKSQIMLPSGVKTSNDGKYKYWQCSLSGLPTFAKPEYWVQIMAKFKTEENLVKTYVCKKAKSLLDAGKTQAEIVALLTSGVKLPKEPKKKKVVSTARLARLAAKVAKGDRKAALRLEKLERQKVREIKAERKAVIKSTGRVRKPRLGTFAVGMAEVAVLNNSGSLEVQKLPVYPWQGDPNYFGDGAKSVMSVAEATRESCARPGTYLDSECQGCPFYDECVFERKYTEQDWKKGKKVVSVKVKKIESFDV